MKESMTINNIPYSFTESFDMNLTLDYENTSWYEWHILREFISNALDSVNQDTSLIDIFTDNGFVHIRDWGNGYPLVYAKRIGASCKKNDASTIGQFGEGTKMAVLTCVRMNLSIMLASCDWLVVPSAKDSDGQQVLYYDVYKTEAPITGSFVLIEATNEIQQIIDLLPDYFLHYRPQEILYGNGLHGIFPMGNVLGRLYNKGVYIKSINSLFSYGLTTLTLSMEESMSLVAQCLTMEKYIRAQQKQPLVKDAFP